MALTDAGCKFIASAIINDGLYAFFNNANAYIGIGDSSTAYDASQTNLQAATNKLRKLMDDGYPQRTDNVLTFHSTFGPNDANFEWNEWGVFNSLSGGTMINRKVEPLGTKLNTQTWDVTVQLSVG